MSASSARKGNGNNNSERNFEKREKRRRIRKLQEAIDVNNIQLVQEILVEKFDVDFQYRAHTSLQLAVRLGFFDICQLLINAGADVNAADVEANSLLIISSQLGYDNIATLLIQHNANTNFQNSDGDTALNICACEGNTAITSLLLSVECDINICNYRMESPLYSACRNGHIDIVKVLVAETECDINWGSNSHYTPLMISCELCCLEAVKVLLSSNCLINKQDRSGQTALYIASVNGYIDIIKELIKAKADTNISTVKGNTPLLGAIRNNHVEVVKLLIEAGCDIDKADRLKQTPLHAALKQVSQYFDAKESKPVELVNLLVQANVKLDVFDNQGWSPLYQAGFSGEKELCRLLYEKQAPIDGVTLKGETLLHGAVFGNNEEIVQMFVEAGCPVDVVNKDGQHPLHTAISTRSKYEIIKALIEAGSNLNLPEPTQKQTPLHEAICQHYTEAAILLIDSGCDLNVENDKRQTPLFKACEKGSNKVVQHILKQPALNKKPANATLVSPLHIACKQGFIHIVEMLVEAGYDIDMLNFEGLSPFQTALQEDKPAICKILLNFGCDIDAHNTKMKHLMKCCLVYDDPHPHFCLEPFFLAMTHKNIEMIKIMIQSYEHLPHKVLKLLDTILKTTSEINVHYSASMRQELGRLFQNAMKMPRSLLTICRNKIRSHLGAPLKDKVSKLQVANKVKDYLLMSSLLDKAPVEELLSDGWS
ncbi:ankyrin-3 isoform X1 [Patella vulgata]|uniref:ankyrin-3 isoform X1 n=2 Tax=Patella vulgata TaxID=6465 RepID=UPI0024A80726|nr:ankyrin-3 isoform X1 [Patella vulgata]